MWVAESFCCLVQCRFSLILMWNMKRSSPAMIMLCKTLSVFVYSRLLPRTCVCIDICGISLHICALMPLNALNIRWYTVCVFVFLYLSFGGQVSWCRWLLAKAIPTLKPETVQYLRAQFRKETIHACLSFLLSFFLLALSVSLLFFLSFILAY